MLNAKQRFRNGQVTFSTPSRFIKEIDPQYIFNTDAPHRPAPIAHHPSPTTHTPISSNHPHRLTPTKGIQEKGEKKSIRSEWKQDDRVNHRVFGNGTVLSVYRENGNDKIDK